MNHRLIKSIVIGYYHLNPTIPLMFSSDFLMAHFYPRDFKVSFNANKFIVIVRFPNTVSKCAVMFPIEENLEWIRLIENGNVHRVLLLQRKCSFAFFLSPSSVFLRPTNNLKFYLSRKWALFRIMICWYTFFSLKRGFRWNNLSPVEPTKLTLKSPFGIP